MIEATAVTSIRHSAVQLPHHDSIQAPSVGIWHQAIKLRALFFRVAAQEGESRSSDDPLGI
jgi:hypothetical protein